MIQLAPQLLLEVGFLPGATEACTAMLIKSLNDALEPVDRVHSQAVLKTALWEGRGRGSLES